MTTLTTTAAALELSAMIYSTPTVPEVRPSRSAALAVKVGVAGLAVWLAATLAVLIGRWQPPIPAEVSGRSAAVVLGQGAPGR